MMEHEDVRAALELATVEPGGLDRLAAGDTGEAAAVAGHLAGCPGCMDELTRLRRADMLLRPVLATAAPPELRARTLAYVRAVGRERGVPAVAAPMPAAPAVAPAPDVAPVPRNRVAAPRMARRAAWPAAVAAALVVGLAGGLLVSGGRAAPEAGDAAVAFTQVTREGAALLAAPDSARVVLADAAGVARGSVIVARSAGRMVAVAVDLPDPGPGREYRCWVEVGGTRTRLGTMWLTGSVAWWNGPAALPANLGPGSRFGVSLATVGSGGAGEPVLTGGL
jgi:hypothetical protein